MPYKKSKFFIYWFFGGKNNILKKKEYPKIINDINKIGYNAFLIGSMVENKFNKSIIFDGWNF